MLDLNYLAEEYVKCYSDKTRIYMIEHFLKTYDATQKKEVQYMLFPRQKGIAFKLYQAFINLFGNAISLFKNRTATFYSDNDSATTNDEAIGKLWNKLAQDSNIIVKSLKNKKGNEVGVIAFKK